MTKLELPDGFGVVEVEVNGRPPVRLDAWHGWNHYATLSRTHGADAVALGDAWCAWLAGQGLAVSHGAAFKVADALHAEVERGKGPGPCSASPD